MCECARVSVKVCGYCDVCGDVCISVRVCAFVRIQKVLLEGHTTNVHACVSIFLMVNHQERAYLMLRPRLLFKNQWGVLL